MARLENPATRLLHILEAGKKHGPNVITKVVWSDVLKVPKDDLPLLLTRIGKAMALIGEISETVSSNENINPSSYLDWVPNVTKAFSDQSLNGRWSSFMSHIDVHTLNYLSHTADILSAHGAHVPWDFEKIQDLSESISGIVIDIKDSELPVNVKKYMILKLREILLAIDEYEITGEGSIIEVVESVFGHLILNQEFRDSVKDSSASGKFWDFMSKVALIATIALSTLQIPNEVKKYLPPPPPVLGAEIAEEVIEDKPKLTSA